MQRDGFTPTTSVLIYSFTDIERMSAIQGKGSTIREYVINYMEGFEDMANNLFLWRLTNIDGIGYYTSKWIWTQKI